MKTKGKFALAACFALLFILLIGVLLNVDVAPIGPEETKVGLSSVNKAVADALGYRENFYSISKYLGYAVLLTAACFALAGLWQLIQRKSLSKVDSDFIALAGLYAAVAVMYLLFEKVVINCRPVILPGEVHPEPSFPSTHTMLACTIMGSAMMVLGGFVKNEKLRLLLQICCGALLCGTVVFRLLSGVHWLTDILGGLLLSATLLFLFSGLRDVLRKRAK